jgi:hypothetical protein
METNFLHQNKGGFMAYAPENLELNRLLLADLSNVVHGLGDPIARINVPVARIALPKAEAAVPRAEAPAAFPVVALPPAENVPVGDIIKTVRSLQAPLAELSRGIFAPIQRAPPV